MIDEEEERIKAALLDAYKKGKLGIVGAVAGLPESRLRKIMRGKSSLSKAERRLLSIHLDEP